MNPTSTPTRRDALLLGLGAALGGGVPAFADDAVEARRPTSPGVRFLTAAESAGALTQGPAIDYYDSLNLLEIRARMNAPLAGLTVAQARVALREFYATQTLAFTDEESAAIRGIVERMQPALAARAPLVARTPWSFVKLANTAEGGLPHTRGPHIVLPAAATASLVERERKARAAGTLATAPFGRNLLVHEQTHVLQRASPARFEPLFTQVLGFERATPAPSSPWLAEHVVQNPDAPDLSWVFPLERTGGRGAVMPWVVLPDVAQPRMPQDFQVVAASVERDGAGWKFVEDGGKPRLQALDRVPGYDAHFPFADEDFHPNEIAAVFLAHWILQDVPDVDARPLAAAAAAWARRALA